MVVDSFIKYAHFLALSHPYTAVSVAKLFLNQVYKLHGMPTAIISDRDRIFTSKFWSELFHLADVKLRMSSSYHPQSDGQTERLNQTMETYLRCFVTHVLLNGPVGYHWRNSGITALIILLWGVPPLKPCMVFHQDISALQWRVPCLCLSYLIGSATGKS